LGRAEGPEERALYDRRLRCRSYPTNRDHTAGLVRGGRAPSVAMEGLLLGVGLDCALAMPCGILSSATLRTRRGAGGCILHAPVHHAAFLHEHKLRRDVAP
jgi:hypothetical protein